MKRKTWKKSVLAENGKGSSLLKEEGFEEQMEQVAEPYLEARKEQGWLCRGNMRLYYELYWADDPVGTVVFSFGFTETCIKYHEMICYLLKNGYQCAIMDHRGHGRSGREAKDPNVIHVDSFEEYVQDLHAFVQEVVLQKAESGGKSSSRHFQAVAPLCLYGHSMGGCIGARYLEVFPDDFHRAVLNAPMLGLKLKGCPHWAAALLCDINIVLGRGDSRLFYQKEFDPGDSFENSSAGSRARHDYYHEIRCREPACQTSSASYRWAREAIRAGRRACGKKEAARVRTPVLLFQAGKDALVLTQAQERFLSRIPQGELVLVKSARHEIYRCGNEILEPYMAAVLAFLMEKR